MGQTAFHEGGQRGPVALEPGLLKSVLAWRVLATLILCRGDAGLSPEGGGVMLAVLSPQVRRGCDAGSAEPSPRTEFSSLPPHSI